MRDGLEGYAAAPQASADGRSLTLPLSGSYRLKHFRIGTKVVIDLQQAAAEGPATENPGAVTAEALPQVRVRGGRPDGERTSGGQGKSGAVRVDLGGRRII